jgi:L-cysteine:1D-myo-inositol 2-amino-2-deoxy-alpha-D-glucopyranoside ligase
MVHLGGRKMSKSLGNLVFVSDLLKEWEPDAIRLGVISHHYRQEWEWDETLMPTAAERLARWRDAGEGEAAADDVRAALDEDLDTPAALQAVDEAAARGHGVSVAAGLLGVELDRLWRIRGSAEAR